ncbi:2OG-Fe dioxygenase family protein [Lysobacter sp. TY2-98]|uniref:2OG-Fe dioxygenase family protein n=1 Tax=Lysobacter sp. TY2-98 TaxID=2290922 RepID=UPI0019632D66|nr:2OG-Fe dioxygenase family protein [Lysobacter sp. TY2-98]
MPLSAAGERLRERGYAVIEPDAIATLALSTIDALRTLAPTWDALPPDTYLRDGGRYRHRRHSCFVVESDAVTPAPHRAHWQPVDYNALHGGMHRWFEPIDANVAGASAFGGLMRGLGALFTTIRAEPRWYVEAHQFRIDTAGGLGRPTPEGAHRDGVDFVAVVLIGRHGIKGGETRVFDANGPAGERFTLEEPWSALLLDDTRVIHESTPIQPDDGADTPGHRDTLVLTYRARAFQGDD